MKSLHHHFLFLVVAAFIFSPVLTQAQFIPFGGPILPPFPLTSVIPNNISPTCFEGIWFEIGPPTPMPLMYSWASFSYPYGPPTHPGEILLGLAGPFITCTVLLLLPCPPLGEPCPVPTVVGGAPIILFHGSVL